jgi:glutaredoxin-like YruB-family protein
MPKIKIYTTPSCAYCRMAKEYFKKKNVEYQEFNVAEDVVAREELVKKSHQLGVPVIEIGKHVIVGFDRVAIDRALSSN